MYLIFHDDLNVLDLSQNKLRAIPERLEEAIGLLGENYSRSKSILNSRTKLITLYKYLFYYNNVQHCQKSNTVDSFASGANGLGFLVFKDSFYTKKGLNFIFIIYSNKYSEKLEPVRDQLKALY